MNMTFCTEEGGFDLNKWKTFLELVRFPNLFTAMADIMAGGWIAFGDWNQFNIITVFSLLLSSACFYAMGVALNDYVDYALDKIERPERPLPSGRLNRSFVLVIVGIFGLCGLCITYFVGWISFLIACALVISICLYNVFLKGVIFSGP